MPWVSDEDYRRLQLSKQDDQRLLEKFRLKSQCDSCGYQSMDIYPEQKLCCPMVDCEGGMGELR